MPEYDPGFDRDEDGARWLELVIHGGPRDERGPLDDFPYPTMGGEVLVYVVRDPKTGDVVYVDPSDD